MIRVEHTRGAVHYTAGVSHGGGRGRYVTAIRREVARD